MQTIHTLLHKKKCYTYPMENEVIFEDTPIQRETVVKIKPQKRYSFPTRILLSLGLNSTTATILLVGITLCAFALSGWILYSGSQSGTPKEIIYREDIPPEILKNIPREKLREIPSRF